MRTKLWSFAVFGCLVLLVAVEARAQVSTKRESQADTYRDPGTATLYAVFSPGVGHLYARETKKGLTLMLVGYGGLIGGGLGASLSCLSGEGCSHTPFFLGLLVFVGAWGYGIYDAGNAARRTNERNGISASLRPTAITLADASVRPGLALQVRW